MTPKGEVVFLFEVNNILLNNDRIIEDLKGHLEQVFGVETRDRYFALFEKLRSELGYADYLGALQNYRLEYFSDGQLMKLHAELETEFLVEYFHER